ncbi:MAG: hypothetical protein II977_00670 [Oscillospiraceae bacterium]|nr:hypothetical protein [Oscillospiraceae bacterium]
MENIHKQIEKIKNKDDFLAFLNQLSKDFRENSDEWENKTAGEYIRAMASWTEDYSAAPNNDIDWDSPDYKTLAKILFMGKFTSRILWNNTK